MDNNGFSEPPLFFPVGGISVKDYKMAFFCDVFAWPT